MSLNDRSHLRTPSRFLSISRKAMHRSISPTAQTVSLRLAIHSTILILSRNGPSGTPHRRLLEELQRLTSARRTNFGTILASLPQRRSHSTLKILRGRGTTPRATFSTLSSLRLRQYLHSIELLILVLIRSSLRPLLYLERLCSNSCSLVGHTSIGLRNL